MQRRTRHRLSGGLAAICAGSAAYHYEALVNPGHGQSSAWFMAGLAAVVGLIWALFVFPRMGRAVVADMLWILAAFPAVGAATGLIAGVGTPIGLGVGAFVAVSLPFMFPAEILPIYLYGAGLAFLLPRIGLSKSEVPKNGQ